LGISVFGFSDWGCSTCIRSVEEKAINLHF
jgi:hypothetical protein